jgi:hypothetical protein
MARNHPVAAAAGAVRAGALARKLPRQAWQRLSAGPGTKGHRCHHWAWVAIGPACPAATGC